MVRVMDRLASDASAYQHNDGKQEKEGKEAGLSFFPTRPLYNDDKKICIFFANNPAWVLWGVNNAGSEASVDIWA